MVSKSHKNLKTVIESTGLDNIMSNDVFNLVLVSEGEKPATKMCDLRVNGDDIGLYVEDKGDCTIVSRNIGVLERFDFNDNVSSGMAFGYPFEDIADFSSDDRNGFNRRNNLLEFLDSEGLRVEFGKYYGLSNYKPSVRKKSIIGKIRRGMSNFSVISNFADKTSSNVLRDRLYTKMFIDQVVMLFYSDFDGISFFDSVISIDSCDGEHLVRVENGEKMYVSGFEGDYVSPFISKFRVDEVKNTVGW